jgi:hypothetical protein
LARLRLVVLLFPCVLPQGCSFFCYGARNLIEVPIDARDEHLMCCRFEHMAEDAWDHEVQADPSLAEHYHYGSGFRAGFVHYLQENGNGQPPAAAPWIYRTAGFETPQGEQDVRDWYAGFRQGAAAARAGGYREAAVVLPMALPLAYTNLPPGQNSPAGAPPAGPPDDAELLPFPHKAPAPPEDGGRPKP